VDVREGEYLTHLLDTLAELRKRGHSAEVLFLEASEEAWCGRYRETRRRHPLAPDGNVLDGIRAERKMLSTLREVADRVVDSSALTVHQLKDLLVEHYVTPGRRSGLSFSLVSFGFKHGVPVRRRSRVRRALPAQPALRGGTAAAGRARQPGAGLRHEGRGEPRAPPASGGLPGLRAAGLPARGQGVSHGRGRLHGGRHRSVALVEELKAFSTGSVWPRAWSTGIWIASSCESRPLAFCFGVHNHQPIGNFDSVLAETTELPTSRSSSGSARARRYGSPCTARAACSSGCASMPADLRLSR
jgi:hypothetical protein